MILESLTILLLILLIIIVSIILYTVRFKSKRNEESESLSVIDKAIEIQQSSINEISRDLQAFQDPLSKLNRYLSGGTLAGKFLSLIHISEPTRR